MKNNPNLVASPLNYTGGKYKLLPQILPLFPKNIDIFVDLCCGGCNVGINVESDQVRFYDKNPELVALFQTLQRLGWEKVAEKVGKITKEYQLSDTALWGYEPYKKKGFDGLDHYNREKFCQLRKEFNEMAKNHPDYYVTMYVLVVFSFNNQIRFNQKGAFNSPVGKRDFNQNMQRKLSHFLEKLKGGNYQFFQKDFRDVSWNELTEKSLVYVDPPYLITCATYNEQGGWGEQDELALLQRLDQLSLENIPFALSNLLVGKGRKNEILASWLQKNSDRYQVHFLNYNYKNSNYQRAGETLPTQEILVTNYNI